MPDETSQKSQPHSMFSTWIGVVLLFAFFGLLALVVLSLFPRGNSYEEKRAKVRAEKLLAANDVNMKALTTYGWVDKSKGVVRIPINEAMMLVANELAKKAPEPANPIAAADASPPAPGAAPAPPAPAPATSASGTPTPTTVTGPNSENRSQPAAASNPPPAPPGTQPGASTTPSAPPPSAAVKAPVSPSVSPATSAPGTPLPVRGKTP